MVKLEVRAANEIRAVLAMALEALTAGGIGIKVEFFSLLKVLRYSVTLILVATFAICNAGFVIPVLAYYWSNPVVWLAVSCMRQDIELSSDERVVSILDF